MQGTAATPVYVTSTRSANVKFALRDEDRRFNVAEDFRLSVCTMVVWPVCVRRPL